MRIAGLALVVACGGSEPVRSATEPVVVANADAANAPMEAAPDLVSSVHVQDDRGWTPLMHAAMAGNLDEIDRLLAAGAQIDANTDTTYGGATPLLIALEFSQAEAAMRLVERGASIAGTIGPRALTLAARNGDMVLVEYLLAHGIPASGDAVTSAARYGYADVVVRLVKAGAPVNEVDTDDHNYTPLIVACQENKVDVVTALLKAGAKVDAVDDDGNGTLYWAVYGARPVEIHEYEELGKPHDTYRVPQRDAPIVKLLIDAKANVNARNPEGDTPLHEAAILDAAAAAQVLLDAGASRTIKNKAGHTAYDIARQRKNSVAAVLAPKRP